MGSMERNGVRIYYEVEGDGPPLVLLHGLGTSSELWRVGGYVDALASHRLIMIDARGQGRSTKPLEVPQYAMAEHAADVIGVMDELGVDRAALFGFSLGGSTAMLVAAQYPTRVSAVISMGARPTAAEFADVPRGDPTATLEGAALFETQGMSWIVDLLEGEGRPQWAELMRASDPAANARQHRAWADPAPTSARLSDIAAPMLMIWGEAEKPDPMLPLPPSADVLVIPGADHAGALEAIDVVVPRVLSFLSEGRSRRWP